jgi:hypothetical protein
MKKLFWSLAGENRSFAPRNCCTCPLLTCYSGQTKSLSPQTEASSYHDLALVSGMLPPNFSRATTEEDALDSYQNLLFSIARFYEYTGNYPRQITVVGYEMKRKRYEELHRAAIRWPASQFHYVGVDAQGQDIEQSREGEVCVRLCSSILPIAP